MNKIMFFGLLSLVTMNYLVADEYISDAYLEEISVQTEVISEPTNVSVNESSLDSLPMAKIIEEEIVEEKSIDVDLIESSEDFIEVNQTLELTSFAESNSSIEDENITLSPYLKALKKARDEGKIVMIAIRGMYCKYCDKMETETLNDKSVQKALSNNFITVEYNQDLESLPLALQKGITPNFIFVDTHEDILNQYPGLRSPTAFKEVLQQILSM